jgi:hypothetical protein
MKPDRTSRIAPHGDDIVVTVPLTLKRRGGRKEITSSANPRGAASAGATAPLALTIARAHRWRTLLESGRYGTIRELSGALGMDNAYVARLLRLTLVAPDIIEAILEGTEPDGLSLEKLFRLPADWERQRDALGMCQPR